MRIRDKFFAVYLVGMICTTYIYPPYGKSPIVGPTYLVDAVLTVALWPAIPPLLTWGSQ